MGQFVLYSPNLRQFLLMVNQGHFTLVLVRAMTSLSRPMGWHEDINVNTALNSLITVVFRGHKVVV